MSAVPDSRRSAGGFTLFEVLIAFFVISIGLVGVVSLQAMSKASQHQAVQRSRAVMLADQMLEMIRGNPRGVARYNIGANAVGGGSIADEPSPDCFTTACDPNEMAAHDLWSWERTLDGAGVIAADGGATGAGLIQPRGCIVFTPDAANGKARTGTVDVLIQWRGLQETTDAISGGFVCGSDFANAATGFRRQVVLSTYVVDEREL
ncbi:type IV pilus modification protein PilV [Pseudohaliea rubra]|uniref:Type IV fimbrial biogenesis protein PilV n=1 Tax=Pseudohaliea rubra DSM 19751 TaxID=1265313 RepID=A0A095VRL7_9GAMM|nr:type IV pilus modification protein PilV [Pseudohaliea rubra]KGE03733.1 Type IV fimbrial biogenesis protein PilV [Pseudohaliea rubra DSM 19751]